MSLESRCLAAPRARLAGSERLGARRAESGIRASMRPSSMRFPTLPAGAKSIAEDPLSLRVLYLLFGVLLAILPLAHVTALRNSLIGLIGLLALLNVRKAPWRSI